MEVDVLNNVPNKIINCLDKGFVKIIDCMPRLVPEERPTADGAIVQAARVSYGNGTKTVNEDVGLIRYLLRHSHSTPQEMVVFKFHMKMPIFVARQIVRHRMASLNEVSGRYSILKDEFYFPQAEQVRQQSKTNKQGGDEQVDVLIADDFIQKITQICESNYDEYEKYLEQGISREQSRMILPINLYTEWYWKIDLKNLLHFLALRCDPHSQEETRIFANAILTLIEPIVPVTIEAWNDYDDHRGAIKLTRLEIEALMSYVQWQQDNKAPNINSENKRERLEWVEKAKKFGLNVS